MIKRSRVSCALILLCTFFATSACGAESSNAHLAPTATSESPASTPTETPVPLDQAKVGDLIQVVPPATRPKPPAAMQNNDKKGAKEAAIYFFTVLNHSSMTGDVELLQETSDAKCEACTGLVEQQNDLNETQELFASDPFRVIEVSAVDKLNEKAWGVTLKTQALSSVVYSAEDMKVTYLKKEKEETYDAVLVRFNEGKWTVIEWGLLS
ncbi:DUF6318 family protein [Timonella sp. A28]|uniref:DUF6318 family protein n=1 Tax=Timonella sp. A28 TaxID=3442640 RepID=UPI003EBD5AC2